MSRRLLVLSPAFSRHFSNFCCHSAFAAHLRSSLAPLNAHSASGGTVTPNDLRIRLHAPVLAYATAPAPAAPTATVPANIFPALRRMKFFFLFPCIFCQLRSSSVGGCRGGGGGGVDLLMLILAAGVVVGYNGGGYNGGGPGGGCGFNADCAPLLYCHCGDISRAVGSLRKGGG